MSARTRRISALVSYQLRSAQTHQVSLVSNLTQMSPIFQERLAGISSRLYGLGVPDSVQAAYKMVYGAVSRQATLLSFVDTFHWIVFMCVLCAPAAFLFEKGRKKLEPH